MSSQDAPDGDTSDAGGTDTHMRLNRTPEPGSPNESNLTHEQSSKLKASNYIRDTLGPDVKKVGAAADTETTHITGGTLRGSCVRSSLRGWETKKGMDHCMDKWDLHLKKLANRLSAEASAIDSANSLFERSEDDTRLKFRQPGSALPYSPISEF